MKTTALTNNSSFQKGFTLIELIVVIAILGVLSVVLLVVIDPLDKINSANDTGVVSALAQFGKAQDAYAATHNNAYVSGANISAVLATLAAQGESKLTGYTAPSGYTTSYLQTPTTCTTAANDCVGYAFIVSNLKSKKNINGTPPNGGPRYQYVNGKGCFVTTAITQAQLTTGSGAGFCP